MSQSPRPKHKSSKSRIQAMESRIAPGAFGGAFMAAQHDSVNNNAPGVENVHGGQHISLLKEFSKAFKPRDKQ